MMRDVAIEERACKCVCMGATREHIQDPPSLLSPMDRRHTPAQDSQGNSNAAERRRVRSISQPGPSFAHAGFRPSERTPLMGGAAAAPDAHFADPFDFDFLSSYNPLAEQHSSASTSTQGYDEAAFRRAAAAFQQQSPFNPASSHSMPTPPPSMPNMPTVPSMSSMPNMPNLPGMSNVPSMSNMPTQGNLQNPTQAFLAALPWLQMRYQMQQQQSNQYGQPMQHQTHHVPFPQQPQAESQPQHTHTQLHRPPSSQPQTPWETPTNPFTAPQSEQTAVASPASSAGAPSPPQQVDVPGDDPVAIAEDKRRRNTAASGKTCFPSRQQTILRYMAYHTARFRIKKKQWTLNLERTISDLSSRVQELEVEAAELRRENGWLKEIVMLKSKQNAQAAAAAGEAGTSASASSSQPDLTDASGGGEGSGGTAT